MKRLSALAGLLLLAACAVTPAVDSPPRDWHVLSAAGPVSVRWLDPSLFTEARVNRGESARQRDRWMGELASYLHAEAGRRLPLNHVLRVDIVDVKRAGDYEPWLGVDYQHVRILRDGYPPRVILRHVLRDATGDIVSEGEERLSGTDFLQAGATTGSDPLRHEKRLLRDWAARRLGPAR